MEPLKWAVPTAYTPRKVSTTPTTTEALPYPTSTEINRGDVLCWKDYKRDGYESFTSDDAYEATTKFCDSNFTLTPDNNDGVGISHPVGDLNLFASIKWATDQSGCLKKGDLNLSFEYVGCVEAFAATLAECKRFPIFPHRSGVLG